MGKPQNTEHSKPGLTRPSLKEPEGVEGKKKRKGRKGTPFQSGITFEKGKGEKKTLKKTFQSVEIFGTKRTPAQNPVTSGGQETVTFDIFFDKNSVGTKNRENGMVTGSPRGKKDKHGV